MIQSPSFLCGLPCTVQHRPSGGESTSRATIVDMLEAGRVRVLYENRRIDIVGVHQIDVDPAALAVLREFEPIGWVRTSSYDSANGGDHLPDHDLPVGCEWASGWRPDGIAVGPDGQVIFGWCRPYKLSRQSSRIDMEPG